MRRLIFCICFVFVFISAYTQPIPSPLPPSVIQFPFDNGAYQQPYINDLFRSINTSKENIQYPIIQFSLAEKMVGAIDLSHVKSISLIDARFDRQKVGFYPCDTKSKNELRVVGLQLTGGPAGWLQKNFFEKNVITDSNSKRQLVIVLRKFWFGHSAIEFYTKIDPPLITSLYYRYDLFSLIDSQYYPLKKIEGVLSMRFKNSSSYNVLSDSMLMILKKEISHLEISKKETGSSLILPADFRAFYNQQLRNIPLIEKKVKGFYKSYQDFIKNMPTADSAEFVVKYNNYERFPMYACQLVPQHADSLLDSRKLWGYFDGESLFINVGEGVYLKLIRNERNFIFLYLRNIGDDRITKDMLTKIFIAGSAYPLLKSYTKKFAITYELDFETGKLY